MTVISNAQGCGQMSTESWVDVISISGEDPKEESKGPQEPKPVGGGDSPLGGGVLDDIGDTVLDVVEEGGNIIVDALNKALDTMPKTSLEVAGGALDVVTGKGGEMVEDVVDKFTESVAEDVGTAIEKGVDDALPNKWETDVEMVWTSDAKAKVELNLKYNWTICEQRNLEMGGELFAVDIEFYAKVGGGYQSGNGFYGDAAGGIDMDLWHQGSGWGVTGGVEQGVNGGTSVYGGFEVSFGK